MMQLQRIAEATTFGDADSVRRALEELRLVPEHELQYYLVLRDTLQATSPETRKAITLAKVEEERRANIRVNWLAISTTILSGVVGLLGVALGAYLKS